VASGAAAKAAVAPRRWQVPNRPATSRRRGRQRWAAGIVAVVIVVAVVLVAIAVTGKSGPSYRTAAVQRGSVAQTLTTTGTLSPVRNADVDFQVAGTVGKVRAVVGHKVVAGQVLARLDRSTLQAALGTARSELTNARERLSQDQTSEADIATAAATVTTTGATKAASITVATVSSPRPSGSPGSHPQPPGGPVTTATLTHDQAAVRAAQHATDGALATAKTALATEATACASEESGTPPTTTTPLTCTQAAKGLLHDQSVVNNDETTVDTAELTLSGDLATATKAFEQREKSASSGGTHSHRTSGSGSTRTSGTTATATAADIANDQSTIDQAAAQVATAKANLRQTSLTAPINGTVTAITIAKGDTVSGGSSSTTPAVEIVGSKQDKATVYVSDTQVRTMKVGLPARITPDGSSQPVTGRVVGIGITGTESDSGSIDYPVTIDVARSSQQLVAGADAAISITLATAPNVIAVPTSAVHYQGSATYVDVLSAGKEVRRTVVVGAIGPALTEITSGLAVGQRVILADLNAAVPSSSTNLTRRGGFGGGFGGGGGFTITRGPGAGGSRQLVSP
jgi:HlyD family secretion protein